MGTRIRESLLYYALKLAHRFDRRVPDFDELGSQKIQRILLVSSTALGDALLSTPAFRAIRQTYPWAKISLLLNHRYLGMFTEHPDVDEIIPHFGGYRRFIRLAWQLKKANFDLICILHGNEPQATPLAYLSGARFIFKLPNTSRNRFLLTNKAPVLDWSDLGHGILQRLRVAALAGAPSNDLRMSLPITEERRQQLNEMLARQGIRLEAPLIGLQIGASSTHKCWPPRLFVELGERLLKATPDLALLVTGAPNEKILCEIVAHGLQDRFPNRKIWMSAGNLPIELLPALLKHCLLLVTSDTGPMHLAIAVNTPVVALFAPTGSASCGPAYDLDHHIVIQKQKTCAPCLRNRCTYKEATCMLAITVDDVEEAVKTILARP